MVVGLVAGLGGAAVLSKGRSASGRAGQTRPPSDGDAVAVVSLGRRWFTWAQASVSAAARVGAWGNPSRANLVVYRSRGPNVVILDPDFTAKGGKVAIVWLDGALDAAKVVGIVYPTAGRDGFVAANQEVFAALLLPDNADIGNMACGDTLKVVH